MQGYVVCCHGDLITMWMTSDWSKVRQFKGHEDRVESVQLRLTSRGGREGGVAGTVVSASRDRTVKYWDINRYQEGEREGLLTYTHTNFHNNKLCVWGREGLGTRLGGI